MLVADKDGIQKQLFNDSDVDFYHFLFPYSYFPHPLAVLFLVANNLLGKHVESRETQVPVAIQRTPGKQSKGETMNPI